MKIKKKKNTSDEKYILNQGDMFRLSLPFIPESKKAKMILAGLLTCSRI